MRTRGPSIRNAQVAGTLREAPRRAETCRPCTRPGPEPMPGQDNEVHILCDETEVISLDRYPQLVKEDQAVFSDGGQCLSGCSREKGVLILLKLGRQSLTPIAPTVDMETMPS